MLGCVVSAVGGGVVGVVEDWRVGLRLRLGVETVVLEFELWVLVLLSLESVWGCGFDFDLVLRPWDLDLKNPISLSLGFGIWLWCLSARRLVSLMLGLVLAWVEYRLDVIS
jgi:hypothetical protein